MPAPATHYTSGMPPYRKIVRKQADQEQALSEVIGFVLILGLIVIFITLWMTYVVPAEGRETEIRHMNDVRDWFTQYKITLDSLWINNGDDTLTGITISNSLTLGSQGGATQAGGFYIPLMKPIGSTGGLAVVNYGETISIKIGALPERVYPLWVLEFNASNNYWVPQTYYYQMGGVFLRQDRGTVTRVAPLIGLSGVESGSVRIQLIPVNISGGGQTSFSGQGPVRIDTRLTSGGYEKQQVNQNIWINLTLRNDETARAWANSINETWFLGDITNCVGCTRQYTPGSKSFNISIPSQNPNVELILIHANYSVSLQSIATGVT
ncbi:hypothetical protein ASZ90_015721 [hydrocarbon metagenome]|uniref:Uncharacterized protein n=1 Tax=hydrocarbon metagenome TaxID=938273 RepID=A0A0W8F162_9ZZZZ